MKSLIFSFILCLFTLSIQAQDTTIVDNFQQTDEVLSTIVTKALTLAEQTGDFVIEQAPLVIQEFFMWRTATHIFWIMFAIVLFVIGYRLPFMWVKSTTEQSNSRYDTSFSFQGRWCYEGEAVAAWITFGVGSLLGIVIALINTYNLIYILVAPKLYLIEYFINLNN